MIRRPLKSSRGVPIPIVVNDISQFASKRGMELNPKKCKEMIITFLKYNHTCFSPIYISGVPVELVSTFKLLGVHWSNDLTWNSHADYIMKKANSRLYSLRKLRKAGLKQSDFATVYCSFIRSILEYASPSWPTLSSTLSNVKLSPFNVVLLKSSILTCHMPMRWILPDLIH